MHAISVKKINFLSKLYLHVKDYKTKTITLHILNYSTCYVCKETRQLKIISIIVIGFWNLGPKISK